MCIRDRVGKNVLGKGYDIELQVFDGYGSYVAGEETAMLELSLIHISEPTRPY